MFFGGSKDGDIEEYLLKTTERFQCQEILTYLLNEFSNFVIQEKIPQMVSDLGVDIGPWFYEALFFSGRVAYDQDNRKLKIQ